MQYHFLSKWVHYSVCTWTCFQSFIMLIHESQITWKSYKTCCGRTCFLPTVPYLAVLGIILLSYPSSQGHSLRSLFIKNKSCHEGLLRRSTEAEALQHEIWEANICGQAGIIMAHADSFFRKSCFPAIWLMIPGITELILWAMRIFSVCAAVERFASWITRLVDHWLPL